MEQGCPVCNGLQELEYYCPLCGHKLTDGGQIENYYGSYSPYMDKSSLILPAGNYRGCIHLLFCPACNYDTRIEVELVGFS